ncbi:unnamed protein product [Moneuplotes crassus]|uniref:Uncharacterized protein n=1 Tax=Euplotes crassus TaxID=5936 RepID=A0AAD1UKS4_EUPCR|nr:unnamed protein product [Moneuplotes crassus]
MCFKEHCKIYRALGSVSLSCSCLENCRRESFKAYLEKFKNFPDIMESVDPLAWKKEFVRKKIMTNQNMPKVYTNKSVRVMALPHKERNKSCSVVPRFPRSNYSQSKYLTNSSLRSIRNISPKFKRRIPAITKKYEKNLACKNSDKPKIVGQISRKPHVCSAHNCFNLCKLDGIKLMSKNTATPKMNMNLLPRSTKTNSQDHIVDFRSINNFQSYANLYNAGRRGREVLAGIYDEQLSRIDKEKSLDLISIKGKKAPCKIKKIKRVKGRILQKVRKE